MKIRMLGTKNSLLILILSLLMNTTFSQTIVPGGTVSGTWNNAGSPYLVQGAIMVADGTSLTIEPGVKVEFQGQYKFLVLGQVLAIGNVTDSITFTATDTTTGWMGIRFDNTVTTNDTSKFYFCKILYGKADGTSSLDKGGAFEFQNYSKAVISNSLIASCFSSNLGGGIYCSYSNPLIQYNTFKNNSVYLDGGGIYSIYSHPEILNNTFINNYSIASSGRGGGVCVFYDSSYILISNNTFISNSAKEGAAFFSYGIDPILDNNTFESNTGTDYSCICTDSGDPIISNSYFYNNYGTVIYCKDGDPVISNNTIEYNDGIGILHVGSNVVATIRNNIISNNNDCGIKIGGNSLIEYNYITNNTAVDGAGIRVTGHYTHISNNIIANNTATNRGGGIYFWLEYHTLTNNTIINNQAEYGGGIACIGLAQPSISNTIIWNNCANHGPQVYLDDDSCDPDFFYCDIEGGSAAFGLNTNVFYLGTYSNNIDADPVFIVPSGGCGNSYDGYNANWELSINSPCINAGNPSGTYPSLDLLGNPRVQDGIIDMGAIESISTSINEVNQMNSYVFPNPSNGCFTINSLENKDIYIEILNINGEKVFEQYGSNKIDLSKYSKGIYLVKAFDKNKIIKEKIILQ